MNRYLVIIGTLFLCSCAENKHKITLMEYITKGEVTEASRYYAKNKIAMQDQDTVNTVKMISAQLDRMEKSQADLLSASLLHTAKWFKNQDNWHYLKENIAKSKSILSDYESNSLLTMRIPSPELDNLKESLRILDTKYQESMPELFNQFNHFSGKNFFNIIPTTIQNKDDLFLSSSLPRKIKLANLKDSGLFYRAYYNTLKGAYMSSLRKSLIDRSVHRFLAKNKRLTLFEINSFENYLSTIELSSKLLNFSTKPVIYILDNNVDFKISTTSIFKLSKQLITPIFSDKIIESNLSPYTLILIPRTSKIAIKNKKTTYIPSKFQSGYKMEPNPKFKENVAAKQKALSDIAVAASALDAVNQEIYKVTQKASLKENELLTGQSTENYVVSIPAVLLEKKSKAVLAHQQATANSEKAEVVLLQTDKEISVPIYEAYQIERKELELKKTLLVDFYIKKSFQKGYYKYSKSFSEKSNFKLLEKVHRKDKSMLKKQAEIMRKFEEYKNIDIKIIEDISEISSKINARQSVNTLN